MVRGLTDDVDFETLARRYFEEKKAHSGIIIAVRRPPKSYLDAF
jgi:hypothetical protein